MAVTVFVDGDSEAPNPLSNKRKLSLFSPPTRRTSRFSSLWSLSSSRKSSPTCTISLECATIAVPSLSHPTAPVLQEIPPLDANIIPFPSSTGDDDLEESVPLDASIKVRRRSMRGATPRSSLSEENRSRQDSQERSRQDSFERTRKSSMSKRKPSTRRHNLLAPTSKIAPAAPRKRLPHIKQSDLRFMTVVRRSVQVGLDERMVDEESDLQEQDRLFVLRLGEQLAERGIRDDADAYVLTPSQIVASVTLRRRDTATPRINANAPRKTRPTLERRRSPLADDALSS